MLQLRSPQSRTLGIRAAPPKPRQRSGIRAARHLGQRRVVCALAAALRQKSVPYGGGLNILLPSLPAIILLGASGGAPVFIYGRWWTVISANWLHGSLLHIVFNMMWVRDLAPVVADVYGPGRMVIIYTAAGICGFLLSSFAIFLPRLPLLAVGGYSLGASAAVFGLLGALVYYGRRTGSSLIRGEAVRYAVILGVMGLIIPGVDNFAHAGGFFGGYLTGRLLDPLKPERVDHIVVAVICLAAVVLSIVASVITGLPLLVRS